MSTDTLEGIWQPLYAELGGEEAPRLALEQMELELQGGTYTVRFGGVAADQGTYFVETEGHLTLRGVTGPNQGRTIPTLFKFVDGMLSLCYGLGGIRPAHFRTEQNPQLYLVNYRRKE